MDTQQIIAALEQRAAKVGLSMATVCGRAKVAQSTITRWKSGIYEPTLKALKKLDAVIAEAEAATESRHTQSPAQDRVLAAVA